MIAEFSKLIDEYLVWLRDRTVLAAVDEKYVSVTTPYLDRNNDYIRFYARREDGGYLLTDDGNTLAELEQSGCALDSPKRKRLLETTLAGYGVRLEENAIAVHCQKNDFPRKKHTLVQAILSINDLFFLAQPMVQSLFLEDVVAWLDAQDVRYTRNVKLSGKSGYDNLFNFVIPKSKARPERLLEPISAPSHDAARRVIFKWVDVQYNRSDPVTVYILLNDQEATVSDDVSEALLSYDMHPVLWSNRDSVAEELAA